jgi:TPR repeat protein
MKRAAIALTLVLAMAKPAAAGTLEDAEAAYARGNRDLALKLIAPLAERSDPAALVLIGRMYYHCDGLLPDYGESVRWFRKAAELGDRFAEFSLGNMYYFGRGVAQDHAEAAKWMLRAAGKGEGAAQLNLGYLYHKGHGVPRNDVLAYIWLSRAAVPRAGSMVPAKAMQIRDEVAAGMSAAQIAEAEARAAAFQTIGPPAQ